MRFLSIIDITTGVSLLAGCCAFWRLRLRISNRAISPTLTTVLLGFSVIVAHLLLAKLLWGFPWGGVMVGTSLVAMAAPGVGYFCTWYRQREQPMRDSGIVEILDKPSLGRAHADRSGDHAGAGDVEGNGCPACVERRLCHRPQSAIRLSSGVAQNRCKKTQKNLRPQLPNLRF